MQAMPDLPYAHDCTQRYSFYYELIVRHWTFQSAHYQSLHRVCVIARQLGATVLVAEDARARPDVAAELAALHAARPTATVRSAIALSFFRTGEELGLTLGNGEQPQEFVTRAFGADTKNPQIGLFLG